MTTLLPPHLSDIILESQNNCCFANQFLIEPTKEISNQGKGPHVLFSNNCGLGCKIYSSLNKKSILGLVDSCTKDKTTSPLV